VPAGNLLGGVVHDENRGHPLVVRLPEPMSRRLADLAARSGLNRSQITRLALGRINESDLSRATFAHADALRPSLGRPS
jgi:hypothetical protein